VTLLLLPGAGLPQERVLPASSQLAAQTGAVPGSQPPQAVVAHPPARAIRIVPLEGEGAVNSITDRTTIAPVVEVRNENELPVEGTTVVFELPPVGPGGSFPDAQLTLTTTTNSRGQAMARGFQINTLPGRFNIRVTATYQNLKATHVITQTNRMKVATAGPRKSRKWLWVTLIGMAGGGAAAAVLLTRDTTPTIGVSPGSAVFGPPN
jgi:hypothetical protein